jgi:hypothetical protein
MVGALKRDVPNVTIVPLGIHPTLEFRLRWIDERLLKNSIYQARGRMGCDLFSMQLARGDPRVERPL